jgi:mono/diheme cytochrome c family protein
MFGDGFEKIHHLFVWPVFALCHMFAGWRLFRSGRIPQRVSGLYLAGLSVAAALMVGAGYTNGAMLSGSDPEQALSPSAVSASVPDQLASVAAGQQLFLKNCAHCHGADARGDDGPDLHNLDWTDEQIATRIRNGKKGQMTAFAGKFSPEQIRDVVAYLRTLK